jgi:hypothetical protein
MKVLFETEDMRPSGESTPPVPVQNSDYDQHTGRSTRARSEEIVIRNYDHQRAYDVNVEIITMDEDRIFQERYYLLPGHVESEVNVVPSGEYFVRVTLDNTQEEVRDCYLNESPAHTALIEVGNGLISLTEGIPKR